MTRPAAIGKFEGLDDADRALVARCVAGDHEAMAQIYRRHHRRVFNVVVRMVGLQEAEEISQDVFVRIYKGMRRFRGDSALNTWIYRVAMNVCLSHLTRRSRRAVLQDEFVRQHDDASPAQASPWLRQHLQRALGQLPPGYRAVLVLHDVEGLNHQEIGKILGCREGTSKSQLHKARMRMRELLEPALQTAEASDEGVGR